MDSRPLYFISDLHLSAATPKTYAAFAHFIETTVDDARAVYILGDLFDFCVDARRCLMHRRSRIPALQALCALPRSTALFSALADADTAYPGRLHPRAEPYAKTTV